VNNITILEHLLSTSRKTNGTVSGGEDELRLLFPAIDKEENFKVVEAKLKECPLFRKQMVFHV
jgi:hypothetical protein